MKRMKKYFLLIAVMAVSIISLCFSASAEWKDNKWSFADDYYDFGTQYNYVEDAELLIIRKSPTGNGELSTYTFVPYAYYETDNEFWFDVFNEWPEIWSISDNIKTLIIEEGITKIEPRAICSLKNLETLILPDGLTEIGADGIFNCPKLKNVNLPSSLTTIGDHVFTLCSSLEQLILPSSIKSFGEGVFEGCTSLTKVYYEGSLNLDLPGHIATPEKISTFTVRPIDSNSISLSWNRSTYADYYRLYRYDYDKKKWDIIADKVTNTYYRYQGCVVVPGEKYRFAVRPVATDGNETKWNDFTAAEAVYLIPLQLKATALTGGYKLTWNKVPGAMGYQIWYATKVNGIYKRYKNAYTESFTKTGLKKGTTYYFRVRPVAELSNGTYQVGEFSAPVKVTVK
ncbi:MAG: leucine-rich repeat protein [Acutalibacteraceae bacterium]